MAESTPHVRDSHEESPPMSQPRMVRSPLPKSVRMSLLKAGTARPAARTVMTQLIVERMVFPGLRRDR